MPMLPTVLVTSCACISGRAVCKQLAAAAFQADEARLHVLMWLVSPFPWHSVLFGAAGILNLMMLVLVCANARLIVENLLKYGVLANPAHWLILVMPDGERCISNSDMVMRDWFPCCQWRPMAYLHIASSNDMTLLQVFVHGANGICLLSLMLRPASNLLATSEGHAVSEHDTC